VARTWRSEERVGFVAGKARLSFGLLLSVFSSVATVWIVVLMVVINLDVFGRTVFSSPLPGVPELVKLSIVGIIFLQIGHTLRAGGITRADGLIRPLERRWPRVGYALQGLYSLCGVFLFAILVYASLPLFWIAWTQGEYAGIEGYVTYPVWPVRLILVIGCACAAIQYAIFASQQLSAAFGAPSGPDRALGQDGTLRTEVLH
jgi:TRAP-type C4-dicarboxylate transport system permease small subunit